MEVLKTSQEIVHEGWLIKSPPTKLWRARWRKRWFALRHSGELPGQYFLEYYRDRRCRKLKGRIDLDQCEQVDAGLRFENRKQKYQYMFNVKTPKRTYYLVAESEADMNKWVDAVCQVCGLKAYTQDEEQQCQMFQFESSQESPPISPISTISGPYIPISECISGRRLNDTSSLNSANLGQGPEHYDAPRRLAPSPPRSPTTTDAESVFTDDEWTAPVPSVNWETFPSSAGDSRHLHGGSTTSGDTEIDSWRVRKRFGKMKVVDSVTPPTTVAEKLPAPPRPPKPPHMLPDNPGHNYLNLDGATESSKPTTPATPAPSTPAAAISTVTDESYDFPRSHQPGAAPELNTIDKHLYSNAAPSNVVVAVEETRVFRYDFQEDEPSSPRSESSTTATYSNLPSPLVRDNNDSSSSVPTTTTTTTTTMAPSPPIVYRELKPGRKTSDSTSVISNEPSPGGPVAAALTLETSSAEHSPACEPPSIDRKLKPPLNKSPVVEGPLQLASPPGRGGRIRAASSPTPPTTHAHQSNRHLSTSDEDNNTFDDREEIYYYQQDQKTFIPASNRRLVVLQYLDLDLEATENFTSSTLPPTQSPPNTTVYKTVDFLKTEAFNRTRQRVEEERKQCTDELA